MVVIFMVVLSCWALTNCTRGTTVEKIESPAVAPVVGSPTPKPAEVIGELSWEKAHPERKTWSDFVFSLIEGELFSAFDSAKDATRICPKYRSLATG